MKQEFKIMEKGNNGLKNKLENLTNQVVENDNKNLSAALIDQAESKQDLKALLEENLAMTKEIRAMVRHINVYVAWQRILSWVKLLLLLVPIILGFIYLPPIISDAYNKFLQMLASSIGVVGY